MTIPIHLTEISTFEWSENEKSVTKPPFLEASSRRVAISDLFITRFHCISECNNQLELSVYMLHLLIPI